MKKNELRKILKNKILPELKCFHLYRDILILEIENHILKGFSFDIASTGRVGITFFIQPLYVENQYIVYNLGKEIRDRDNRQWWDLESEGNIYYLIEILKNINDKIFSNINIPLDLFNFFKSSEKKGTRYEEALIFTACKANLKITEELLESEIIDIEKEGIQYGWVLALKEKYELFLSLNQQERMKKLEECERQTIKNLKLEKFIK